MSNVHQDEQAVKSEGMLAEYSDDTLAGMADGLAEEAERLGRLARGAHAELQARMRERRARVLETEHWSGVMKPGPITHTVDDIERFLKRLIPLANKGDIETVFVQPPLPPMRVDHRAINELHDRGGEIAAIIDEERRSVQGEKRLVLTRKPEKDLSPEAHGIDPDYEAMQADLTPGKPESEA